MATKSKIKDEAVEEALKILTTGGINPFLHRTGLAYGCGEICVICSEDHFTIKVKGSDIEYDCKSCGTGNAVQLFMKHWRMTEEKAKARLIALAEETTTERRERSEKMVIEDMIENAEYTEPTPPPQPFNTIAPTSEPTLVEHFLTEALNPTYAASAETSPPPPPTPTNTPKFVDPVQDPRRKVMLPGKGRLNSDFARDLAESIRDQDVFLHGNIVVIPDNSGAGLLTEILPIQLRTWVEEFAVCYAMDEDSPNKVVFKTMTLGDATAALASHQFKQSIRAIRRVNMVRMPVLRRNGRVELLAPGYDEESQILTSSKGVQYSDSIPVENAKQFLRELVQEFPFTDSRSLSVAVAGMLSLYGVGLLPEGCLKPCFIVIANSEGSGKSLLVKLIVLPVVGNCPTGTKSRNEDEIRKLLLAALRSGRPVVVMDNVRDSLESASLEGFLTASTWQDRILGTSTVFSARNDTYVFITGNNCVVSSDMRRRSLAVELFSTADLAEERKFRRRLEEPDLHVLRPHILAALWALVREWDADGRPKASKGHASFPEWANIIGAITEHAGFGSPVETPALRTDTSSEVAEMRKLINAMGDERVYAELNFSDLTRLCHRMGLFERIIGPDGESLDKKAKTTFSMFLKRYDYRHIGGYVFKRVGVGHQRKYAVEKLPKEHDAS